MRILNVIKVGLVACGLGLGAMAVSGCATAPKIPQAAMPEGESFSGLWYTNAFGDMKLTQRSDGTVTGGYDSPKNSIIEGTVEGGVMKFSWYQPGDFQVARREVSGHAYLVLFMGEEGPEVKGEWGYGENYTGGGEWTGRKALEIYR